MVSILIVILVGKVRLPPSGCGFRVRGCGFDLREWNLLQLRCISCSEFGDLVGVGSSVDPK